MTQRSAMMLRWISIAVIVLCVIVVSRLLPVGQWVHALRAWIDDLGMWGAVAYVVIYIVAVVLLIPGSAITLLGGGVFGLWIGLALVSLASTTGSAVAFLIARYGARSHVERLAAKYEKFDAIDRAIGEGGWTIVALLRLSPLVPFNVQNYFYGLTPIGFWTCVLTSWVAMLPGTFLYVYIGYAASEAATGDRQRSVWEWVFLGAGLVATIVVTVYISKLARKQLQQQQEVPHELRAEARDDAEESNAEQRVSIGRAAIAPVVAIVVLVGTVTLWSNRDALAPEVHVDSSDAATEQSADASASEATP